MNTGLTERGALQAAFNLWDDLAKHGYLDKEESEYSEAAKYKGSCILCAYYDLECENCVLGEGPDGEYWSCSSNPNHPYRLWDNVGTIEEIRLHARTIATLINKRLDEVIAAEEGSHA
jgi:hypothetical protein